MITRVGAAALIGSGVAFVGFMLLHPYGQVYGAEVAADPRWIPAHTLHFLGALFALFGLAGLYSHVSGQIGVLGAIGFALAFIGSALFTGTGLITAYIWPVIAASDPSFVAADGPMFHHPLPSAVTGAPYVLMVLGYLLLSFDLWKSVGWPAWPLVPLAVGIIMFSAPVEPIGPAPWILRVLGSIVFGGGLAANGVLLWQRSERVLAVPL